jgi:hypothetical protein
VNVNLSVRHHHPGACRRAPDDPMRGRHPGRPRWFIVTAGASVLSASLAGCSGSDDTGGLPEVSDVTSPAATPTGPTLTPEQQAVADAVTRYDKVIDTMFDGLPLEERKVRSVAVDPWATAVGKKIYEMQALKYRTVGTSKIAIREIRVSGTTAQYVACFDFRRTKVVTSGPTPTDVYTGTAPSLDEFSLVQMNQKWFVKNVRRGKKCGLPEPINSSRGTHRRRAMGLRMGEEQEPISEKFLQGIKVYDQ